MATDNRHPGEVLHSSKAVVINLRKLRALVLRVIGMFGRDARDREIAAELESHLEMHVADNVRAGMSAEEARRQALIKLGGLTQAEEEYRRRKGLPVLEDLWQDLRYGARSLIRQPAFTIVAILTLGLGIGANTALFSIINAVVLRPLPYRDPDRLVILWEKATTQDTSVSYPNFQDWRDQNQSFEEITAYRPENFNLTGAGEPERLAGRMASASFFRTLGVTPFKGTDFPAAEDRIGGQRVVILGHGFWQRRFGGDERVIGRELTLNNQSYSVIGITAPDFRFGTDADVYVLLGQDDGTCARSMEQVISQSINARRFAMLLLTIFAAFALVLASVGIYGVISYSVTQRTHEMGVRMALGAQGRDVLRMVVGQGMMLVFIGVLFGLVGAFGMTRVMSSLLFNVSTTDPATFGGIAVLLVAVALIACYIPARRAMKVDPLIALRYE